VSVAVMLGEFTVATFKAVVVMSAMVNALIVVVRQGFTKVNVQSNST
jgi:hypothetical protein